MRLSWAAFCFVLFFCFLSPQSSPAAEGKVYFIPVTDTVEDGLYSFLKRAMDEAEKNGASAVILEINTPGGAVAAAEKISGLLDDSPLRKIAFINSRALSAGAYIALHADEIYMVPGAVIGSAAVIDGSGNAASKKAQSYWLAAMKSAAEKNGRDPKFALAMASENNDLTEFGAGPGKLLTLTAKQAEKAGYNEGTVKDRSDLLKTLNLDEKSTETVNESFAEKAARFLTHPAVIPILFTIGCLGLVLELFSPGFGIAGIAGLTAFGLFFFGHMAAGLTGYEPVLLFAAGIILLLLELVLPGGIAGVLGASAVAGSLYLTTGNFVYTSLSLAAALIITIVASIIMVKVYGKNMKFFRKIILSDSTATEKGYISNKSRTELLGKKGITLTPLRPSGIALVEGERIDVVSEGSFIQKDSSVMIIKAEGSRIVVREAGEQGGN
ncbi:NfeD family protein [Peribacillus sp. SCS-26]|uniref:NfeD family protein n=1 Tax=Paraperibacillus marinus TaxID=3115295 RepID=UPI003905CC46